jgi:hypothetical protein
MENKKILSIHDTTGQHLSLFYIVDELTEQTRKILNGLQYFGIDYEIIRITECEEI